MQRVGEPQVKLLLERRSIIAGTALFVSGTQAQAAAYVNDRVDGPGYVVSGVTKWILPNFGETLREKIRGTPFSLSLVCAMAYQESGYRWWSSKFRGSRTPAQVLRLLVLDNVTPRNSFPRDTAAFLADARFHDLGKGLIDAADATSIAEDSGKQGKLRYGYGLFQNDLQNIKTDPSFWRDQAPGETPGTLGVWGDIAASTDFFVRELQGKYDASKDVDRAVHDYNGHGLSADVYLYNVKVYANALQKAGV